MRQPRRIHNFVLCYMYTMDKDITARQAPRSLIKSKLRKHLQRCNGPSRQLPLQTIAIKHKPSDFTSDSKNSANEGLMFCFDSSYSQRDIDKFMENCALKFCANKSVMNTHGVKEPLIGETLSNEINNEQKSDEIGAVFDLVPGTERPEGCSNALYELNNLIPGLQYDLIEKSGSDHDPSFTMGVEVNGEVFEGTASSLKKAKLAAAEKALSSTIPQSNGDAVENANGASITQTKSAVVLPTDKRPVSILNELRMGTQYTMVQYDYKTKLFMMEVKVDGDTYNGVGYSTKTAKSCAAKAALKAVFNMNCEVSQANGSKNKPIKAVKRKAETKESDDSCTVGKNLKLDAYYELAEVTPDQCVALDCEFVGTGQKGSISALGRCSIIDFYGTCLMDDYAKPADPITDYRTPYSGIRPMQLVNAQPDHVLREEIAKIIKGKILIGHAIHNDLGVLKIGHPKHDIRDTCQHPWLRLQLGTKQPGLKRLTAALLDWKIQHGPHDSLIDAKASMELFQLAERAVGRLPPISDTKFEKRKHRLRHDSDHSFLEDHYWPPSV